MYGDLHFHSTNSDGNKTPAERIAQIKALDPENKGIWAMTDHDRFSPDFVLPARKEGIQAVWATEISAHSRELDQSLHITCYTPTLSLQIQSMTDSVLRGKTGKIELQIRQLQEKGFPIEKNAFFLWMDSIGHSRTNASNWHLAHYIFRDGSGVDVHSLLSDLTRGEVKTELQFLLECLKENGNFPDIGSVQAPPYEIEVSDLIPIAKQEEAIISVAHPNFSFLKYAGRHYSAHGRNEKIEAFDKHIANRLIDLGLRNFELNTLATAKWATAIQNTVKRSGGILTFGSDNHGWEREDGKTDEKHAYLGILNPHLTEELSKPIRARLRDFI